MDLSDIPLRPTDQARIDSMVESFRQALVVTYQLAYMQGQIDQRERPSASPYTDRRTQRRTDIELSVDGRPIAPGQ
jgi:hypothetical protein